MGLRDKIERLKYTRPKYGEEVSKGAGAVKKKLSEIPKPSLEGIRQNVETNKLAKYKQGQDRRRLAEVKVYGRELTEKERKDFEVAQKKAGQKRTNFGAMFGPAAPQRVRSGSRRTPRRIKYASTPQSQPQSQADLSLGGLLGGSGGYPSQQSPQRRKAKKNVDLSLGGLL